LAIAIGLILLCPAAIHAQNQEIDGQSAPEYIQALALWLDDNEAEALPTLAKLAKDGNTAARLLVGMIDKNASLQGPWLALLSKQDRIALLRFKGGLSGTSWLRQVKNTPSISIWLKILDSQADIETALKLANLGEERLLRAGLIMLEARQTTGFAAFAGDARFPRAVQYLILREWHKAGNFMTVATALHTLHKGDAQRDFLRDMVRTTDHEKWLLETSLAPSLHVLCRANCPQNQGACMRAGFHSLGGYHHFVTQGTPLASLIPEERFAASQRGQRSVLRRALTYAFLNEARLNLISDIDACFAELVEMEGQKF